MAQFSNIVVIVFPFLQGGDYAYRKNGAGKLLQESKNLNCPAQVHMREIVRFPDYKATVKNSGDKPRLCLQLGFIKLSAYTVFQILENTEWRSKKKSKKLRNAINEGTAKSEKWIHVLLPSVDEHIVHPNGDVSSQINQSNYLASMKTVFITTKIVLYVHTYYLILFISFLHRLVVFISASMKGSYQKSRS